MKTAVKSLLQTRAGWALSSLVRPRGTLVLMYHRVGPSSEGLPASTSPSSGPR
jgi:hypothetical protein